MDDPSGTVASSPGPAGRAQANRRARVAAGVAVGVFVLVWFAGPLRAQLRLAIFPQDEGLLLVYPERVLHGAVPNRTFYSAYGALNLWVLAAGYKVVGISLVAERWVGIVYRLVVVGGLTCLAWRRRGPVAALVAGLLAPVLMIGTLGLAAYAWFAAMAASLVGFVLLDVAAGSRRPTAMVAVAGILFGVVVSFRIDLAPAVALALVVVVWARRRWWRPLLPGFAVGMLPVVVSMAAAGPAAVIREQVLDPTVVSGPGRHLPLSGLDVRGLALYSLCLLVPILLVVAGAVRWSRRRQGWDGPMLVALGAFEIGLVPELVQRPDLAHLALVGSVVVPSAVLLPVVAVTRHVNLTPLLVGAAVAAVIWVPFVTTYWSQVTHPAPAAASVRNDGRSVVVGSGAQAAALEVVLHTLDRRSVPGDRVFVGPADLGSAKYGDTYVYFLLPRLTPGSHYLEFDPGVANGRSSQIAGDLASDRFLVLNSQYGDSTAGLAGPGSARATAELRQEFRPVVSSGTWTLYERKSPSP